MMGLLAGAALLTASGPLGIYGIVEKVLEYSRVNNQTDLRVRPASEAPASPALYQTNAGIVKLREGGSHREIVKQLRDALER